jgi:capsular polysaccharide biosynthesis protein
MTNTCNSPSDPAPRLLTMLKTYQIVDVDHLVRGDVPQHYRDDPRIVRALAAVRYNPLMRNWRHIDRSDLFVLHDSYNQRLAREYRDMAGQSHMIAACGELVFDRIWCLGRDGLKVDIENGVIFAGQAANWGRDYLTWWLGETPGFVRWLDDDRLEADFGTPDFYDDNVIMLKSPGYAIYGHWLLDTLPQIMLTRYMNRPAGTRMIFDQMTAWMTALLDAICPAHPAECYQHRLTEHRNLRSPTGLKNGYAMAQPINAVAWNALRAHFNHANSALPSAPEGERLFVSRRNWSGPRALADYSALEDVFRRLGFTIYYPERHSLVEQARAFATARVILGEDGSALHSIMFSDPGAMLGVLMQSDRSNLWHASICDAMGHQLAFHELQPGPDGTELDLTAIERFTRSLLPG